MGRAYFFGPCQKTAKYDKNFWLYLNFVMQSASENLFICIVLVPEVGSWFIFTFHYPRDMVTPKIQ